MALAGLGPYQRAILAARVQNLALTRSQQARLLSTLEQVEEEFARTVRRFPDANLGSRRDLRDLTRGMIAAIESHTRTEATLAARRTGEIQTEVTSRLLQSNGVDAEDAQALLRGTMGNSATRAVQSVLARPELADTFTSLRQGTERQVDDILLRSIGAGRTSAALEQELRVFMRGAEAIPDPLLNDRRLIGKKALSAYMGYDNPTSADVERVRKHARQVVGRSTLIARHEQVNAYHETTAQANLDSPIVAAVRWNLSSRHPEPDGCDVFADEDLYGMGEGIFPKDAIPSLLHPRCLCFITSVLVEALNEEILNPELREDFDRVILRLGLPRSKNREIQRALVVGESRRLAAPVRQPALSKVFEPVAQEQKARRGLRRILGDVALKAIDIGRRVEQVEDAIAVVGVTRLINSNAFRRLALRSPHAAGAALIGSSARARLPEPDETAAWYPFVRSPDPHYQDLLDHIERIDGRLDPPQAPPRLSTFLDDVDLDTVEEWSHRQSVEWAHVWAQDGRPMYRKQGTRSSVPMSGTTVDSFRGATMTHNHPGRSDPGFSPDDLTIFVAGGMEEIRAVGSRRRWSARRTGDAWDQIRPGAEFTLLEQGHPDFDAGLPFDDWVATVQAGNKADYLRGHVVMSNEDYKFGKADILLRAAAGDFEPRVVTLTGVDGVMQSGLVRYVEATDSLRFELPDGSVKRVVPTTIANTELGQQSIKEIADGWNIDITSEAIPDSWVSFPKVAPFDRDEANGFFFFRSNIVDLTNPSYSPNDALPPLSAGAPEWLDFDLEDFRQEMIREYRIRDDTGIDEHQGALSLFRSNFQPVPGEDLVELSLIVIPKSRQSEGIGTEIMQKLIRWADHNGSTLMLTPAVRDAATGTTSRSRLVRFYKRFGFVENKGRNKRFELPMRGGMYRTPQTFTAKSQELPFLGSSSWEFEVENDVGGLYEDLRRLVLGREAGDVGFAPEYPLNATAAVARDVQWGAETRRELLGLIDRRMSGVNSAKAIIQDIDSWQERARWASVGADRPAAQGLDQVFKVLTTERINRRILLNRVVGVDDPISGQLPIPLAATAEEIRALAEDIRNWNRALRQGGFDMDRWDSSTSSNLLGYFEDMRVAMGLPEVPERAVREIVASISRESPAIIDDRINVNFIRGFEALDDRNRFPEAVSYFSAAEAVTLDIRRTGFATRTRTAQELVDVAGEAPARSILAELRDGVKRIQAGLEGTPRTFGVNAKEGTVGLAEVMSMVEQPNLHSGFIDLDIYETAEQFWDNMRKIAGPPTAFMPRTVKDIDLIMRDVQQRAIRAVEKNFNLAEETAVGAKPLLGFRVVAELEEEFGIPDSATFPEIYRFINHVIDNTLTFEGTSAPGTRLPPFVFVRNIDIEAVQDAGIFVIGTQRQASQAPFPVGLEVPIGVVARIAQAVPRATEGIRQALDSLDAQPLSFRALADAPAEIARLEALLADVSAQLELRQAQDPGARGIISELVRQEDVLARRINAVRNQSINIELVGGRIDPATAAQLDALVEVVVANEDFERMISGTIGQWANTATADRRSVAIQMTAKTRLADWLDEILPEGTVERWGLRDAIEDHLGERPHGTLADEWESLVSDTDAITSHVEDAVRYASDDEVAGWADHLETEGWIDLADEADKLRSIIAEQDIDIADLDRVERVYGVDPRPYVDSANIDSRQIDGPTIREIGEEFPEFFEEVVSNVVDDVDVDELLLLDDDDLFTRFGPEFSGHEVDRDIGELVYGPDFEDLPDLTDVVDIDLDSLREAIEGSLDDVVDASDFAELMEVAGKFDVEHLLRGNLESALTSYAPEVPELLDDMIDVEGYLDELIGVVASEAEGARDASFEDGLSMIGLGISFGKRGESVRDTATATSDALFAILQAQYQEAQRVMRTHFRDAVPDRVMLFRGFDVPVDLAHEIARPRGRLFHTEYSPLSSMSTAPSTALGFSRTSDPTKRQILAAIMIETDRVLGFPGNGFGCLGEGECILLGGRAWSVNHLAPVSEDTGFRGPASLEGLIARVYERHFGRIATAESHTPDVANYYVAMRDLGLMPDEYYEAWRAEITRSIKFDSSNRRGTVLRDLDGRDIDEITLWLVGDGVPAEEFASRRRDLVRTLLNADGTFSTGDRLSTKRSLALIRDNPEVAKFVDSGFGALVREAQAELDALNEFLQRAIEVQEQDAIAEPEPGFNRLREFIREAQAAGEIGDLTRSETEEELRGLLENVIIQRERTAGDIARRIANLKRGSAQLQDARYAGEF